MSARKIIICFDGTNNEVGDNESNILKLYKGLVQSDTQIAHYVPGIGTLDGPRLFVSGFRRRLRSLAGLAFGRGLEDDVLDAYRFLCHTYQSAETKAKAENASRRAFRQLAAGYGVDLTGKPPKAKFEDDRIYITGFSRGAYAARILAGFLNNFGLVPPDRLTMIPDVFRAYRSVTRFDEGAEDKVVFRRLRQYGKTLKPDASVPIRALLLFDTVASIVRFQRPLHNLRHERSPMELATHANVVTNPSVRIVLHALAIDERRSMFRPLLWGKGPYYGNRFPSETRAREQLVEQCWFPGYHGDIGGTPREYFSGIGKLTLIWMLERLAALEARADREDILPADDPPRWPFQLVHGYDRKVFFGAEPGAESIDEMPFAKPDSMAPTNDSMSLTWSVLEVLPKTTLRRKWPGRKGWGWYIPWAEPRLIPMDHDLHDSVADRMSRWKFYRPVNVTNRDGLG